MGSPTLAKMLDSVSSIEMLKVIGATALKPVGPAAGGATLVFKDPGPAAGARTVAFKLPGPAAGAGSGGGGGAGGTTGAGVPKLR